MNPGVEIGQALVEFLAWFFVPFAVMLTVEWIVRIFRNE